MARGEDTVDSDLNLLVKLSGDATLLTLASLERERQLGDREACLDGVTIELDEPLDRPLLDVTSGRALRVEQC